MNTYCVTFGQLHPLRDCWIEVEASTEGEARALLVKVIGLKWAFIYPIKDFNPHYFSGGKAGRTLRAC